MDLSLIKTHIDNFVDTWTGWNDVVTGIARFVGFKEAFEGAGNAFEFTSSVLPALSSK